MIKQVQIKLETDVELMKNNIEHIKETQDKFDKKLDSIATNFNSLVDTLDCKYATKSTEDRVTWIMRLIVTTLLTVCGSLAIYILSTII